MCACGSYCVTSCRAPPACVRGVRGGPRGSHCPPHTRNAAHGAEREGGAEGGGGAPDAGLALRDRHVRIGLPRELVQGHEAVGGHDLQAHFGAEVRLRGLGQQLEPARGRVPDLQNGVAEVQGLDREEVQHRPEHREVEGDDERARGPARGQRAQPPRLVRVLPRHEAHEPLHQHRGPVRVPRDVAHRALREARRHPLLLLPVGVGARAPQRRQRVGPHEVPAEPQPRVLLAVLRLVEGAHPLLHQREALLRPLLVGLRVREGLRGRACDEVLGLSQARVVMDGVLEHRLASVGPPGQGRPVPPRDREHREERAGDRLVDQAGGADVQQRHEHGQRQQRAPPADDVRGRAQALVQGDDDHLVQEEAAAVQHGQVGLGLGAAASGRDIVRPAGVGPQAVPELVVVGVDHGDGELHVPHRRLHVVLLRQQRVPEVGVREALLRDQDLADPDPVVEGAGPSARVLKADLQLHAPEASV